MSIFHLHYSTPKSLRDIQYTHKVSPSVHQSSTSDSIWMIKSGVIRARAHIKCSKTDWKHIYSVMSACIYSYVYFKAYRVGIQTYKHTGYRYWIDIKCTMIHIFIVFRIQMLLPYVNRHKSNIAAAIYTCTCCLSDFVYYVSAVDTCMRNQENQACYSFWTLR